MQARLRAGYFSSLKVAGARQLRKLGGSRLPSKGLFHPIEVVQEGQGGVCGGHAQPAHASMPDRPSEFADFLYVAGRSLAHIDPLKQIVDLLRSKTARGAMPARFVHKKAG